MGKFSRNQKQNQGLKVRLESKLQLGQLKVQIKKPEIKKPEIGKPPGLNKISMAQPKIWSTQQRDINIIEFLINEGRHFLLHFAGAKKNLKNEQNQYKRMLKQEKYNEQKSNQPLYEFLESFSENHLGQPSRNKKKERIVVFFFRSNCLHNLKNRYTKQMDIQNENWIKILKEIKFILDETFYTELIELLKKLEENNDIKWITEQLIQQFSETDNLKDIQVIFKNLLIQIFKGRLDEHLYWDKVQNLPPDQILKIYKERIPHYQPQIMKFVKSVKTLFDGESKDNNQNFQYQDIEKDHFDDFDYEQQLFKDYSVINFHSEEF
ncbi:unnamed protein product (macronuclear) [Paramecium tetraurelia]|uniref:Uncharacterized protein n=1 Tax=Paramecium tetraurelia TaxID=5888 RepID=A0D3K1_PARTE|nr:uncharacterized protein GSPATT00013106001 [Paramecium tetraurelia]CAK77618.1 unnamed protein product [Paramecium tetraurelia]|eukprot:XP_001445015.1 hypothetical protein (macronuclear) [Paramecium tetraurelia strain d4-2]